MDNSVVLLKNLHTRSLNYEKACNVHLKMPGLGSSYDIIRHTVYLCEKIIYLNNSVYVWKNYLFKIESWIIRARKMDLSFVVIDR